MSWGAVMVAGLRRSSASPVCTFAGTASFGNPRPGSGVVEMTWTGGALTSVAAGCWANAGTAQLQTIGPTRRRIATIARAALERCEDMTPSLVVAAEHRRWPAVRALPEVSSRSPGASGKGSRPVRDDFPACGNRRPHRALESLPPASPERRGLAIDESRTALARPDRDPALPLPHTARCAGRRRGDSGGLLRGLGLRPAGADRRADRAARALSGGRARPDAAHARGGAGLVRVAAMA